MNTRLTPAALTAVTVAIVEWAARRLTATRRDELLRAHLTTVEVYALRGSLRSTMTPTEVEQLVRSATLPVERERATAGKGARRE